MNSGGALISACGCFDIFMRMLAGTLTKSLPLSRSRARSLIYIIFLSLFPFPPTQWNDKDLDALLNDGDDVSDTPAATKSDKKDDREAERHGDKLAESIAAVRIRTAPEAVHETLAELRSELESLPLSGLFARALKMFTQIHGTADSEGCGARGEEREALIARALTVVQRAQDVAERAGLFSDNEALEDVKTGDLKYLLLPFFAAELLGEEMNMDRRPAALTRAENAYLQFLER